MCVCVGGGRVLREPGAASPFQPPGSTQARTHAAVDTRAKAHRPVPPTGTRTYARASPPIVRDAQSLKNKTAHPTANPTTNPTAYPTAHPTVLPPPQKSNTKPAAYVGLAVLEALGERDLELREREALRLVDRHCPRQLERQLVPACHDLVAVLLLKVLPPKVGISILCQPKATCPRLCATKLESSSKNRQVDGRAGVPGGQGGCEVTGLVLLKGPAQGSTAGNRLGTLGRASLLREAGVDYLDRPHNRKNFKQERRGL